MAKIELPEPWAGVVRPLRARMVKVERDAHAATAVRVLSTTALVIAAACAKPAMPVAAASFDPAPWLQDFAQLEHHLGVAYANLEWSYAHRGLKLDRLASETRLQIRGANSDRQAFRALASFIATFRDPHLTVTPPRGLVRRVRYGLQLATDGLAIVVAHIDGAACDVAAGDVVTTIGDRPALEMLDANLKLSRTSNRATALDWAVAKITDSWFAPEPSLDFTVIHRGREVRCHMSPLPEPSSGPQAAQQEISWSMPSAQACAALGVEPTADPFGFPTAHHPELEVLEDAHNAFSTGIVHLRQGGTLGWLHIPSFSHEAYPRACAEEWDRQRGARTGACGDACQDEFTTALSDRLAHDAVERLQRLARAHVSAIVVDIADNGGGTDWVRDVARAISPVSLQCPAVTGIRHRHWQESLERADRALASCEVPGLAPRDRARLEAERATTARLLAASRQSCDLSGLFEGVPKICSLLLDQKPRAPCDPLPLGGPETPDLPPSCTLFERPWTRAVHGVVDVPVFVLINRSTGSAAEWLAAVLQDNRAATLVGEQTAGAGCGYTDGGIPLELSRTGIAVAVPDCARYRRDGTNEIDGIRPDVALDWTLTDRTGRWASYAEKALSEADRLFHAAQ
jgi:hypothetical protein